MATLKKLTRVGSDVRQIARLLQAKAPEGHMLAYITPEEAELLKSRGGSGEEHEDTGVPSFEMMDSGGFDTAAFENLPPPITQPITQSQVNAPSFGGGIDLGYQPGTTPTDKPIDLGQAAPAPAFNAAQPFASFDTSQFAQPAPASVSPALQQQEVNIPSLPSAMTGSTIPIAEPTKSFGDRAEEFGKYLDKNPGLVKALGLGLTGLGGIVRGSQGAKEAESVRSDLSALGEDYRRQGQELLAKAKSGELTPAQKQQLDAAQAQLAQQVTARGGVGALQSATQIEALRQQYVAQNMDRALQLLNIADQYQANAIKAGYAASKDAQAAADRFYAAMGQYLVPPSQQTTKA